MYFLKIIGKKIPQICFLHICGTRSSIILFYSSKNSPDFFSAGRSAIYTAVATMVDVTALMDVEATLYTSVSSAAGFPKISNL